MNMVPGPMQGPVVPQGQPPGVLPGQLPPQPQEKMDNISKVKSLIGQLRDSLAVTLKTAAQTLHQNSLVDVGNSKGVDVHQMPRFDKSMEEFYSICDQIELHLKTSIECVNQYGSSGRYLSVLVTPARAEPSQEVAGSLTYPQYLATVRSQVAYAKEVHDMLLAAAHNVAPPE